jgi:FAD/FMN-containing dehydrogenase
MLLPHFDSFPNRRLPSAYPPTRTRAFSPFWLYFFWTDPAYDSLMHSFVNQSAEHLKRIAITEGKDMEDAALYPNYAIAETGLEKMYGKNLARLRAIRERIDPEGVMKLAGGWKF